MIMKWLRVAVSLQSQIFKSSHLPMLQRSQPIFFREVHFMPETSVNITEKLQKIGQTAQDYKDAIVNQFKDMEVEVKDWNFSVGKSDKEYTVEVNLKLGIHSKKA
jgi:hypothetical protein